MRLRFELSLTLLALATIGCGRSADTRASRSATVPPNPSPIAGDNVGGEPAKLTTEERETIFLNLVRGIRVEQPSDGASVYNSKVRVEGKIFFSGDIRSVSVQGRKVTLENGRFGVTVDGLEDGDQSILVEVEESRGVRASSSVNITVDAEAPLLTVKHPKDGAVLEGSAALWVSGEVLDRSRIVLTVNGTKVRPGPTGSFRAPIEMPAGKHTLEVVARDPGGRETRVKRSIVVR
jgi:hypothetical protein